MTVPVGARLGPYEILGLLGAGGMGEVYRARDSRLNRDVALKVLTEEFFEDKERRERFEREARTLASLNHPGIAALYSFDEVAGPAGVSRLATRHLLVMELVDGEGLERKLLSGPLPLEESLAVARQIAEALEAAHEKGIVHRDLKPANVKLTEEGKVKLLDFGLAKALEEDGAPKSASGGSATQSPTLTARATAAGVILGTAAYMSPEQARGKPVDKRTDVWAFGCVLYEMLTGKRVFEGETVSDTLAAVLTRGPEWGALREVPPRVKELLRRCLQRDARQRLRDIGEARIAIEEGLTGVDDDAAAALPASSSRGGRWPRVAPWAVTAALAIALATALIVLPSRARPTRAPVMHLGLAAPVRHAEANHGSAVAISPDGTRVAYVGPRGKPATGNGEDLAAPRAESFELVVRKLDRLAATPLLETPGGTAPFFSPDGRWVGFYSGGALRKIPSDGGPPLTVCDVPNIAGASWGDDGYVYFAPAGSSEIRRVPEEGGTPTVVVKAAAGDAVASFRWPQALPGGKAVLFTAAGASWLAQHYRTEAYSLATGRRTPVLEDAADARYVAPGYLVFMRGDVLMGAPFDARALKVTGPAVPLVDGVTRDEWFGSADYAVSSAGTLIYVTGGVQRDYRLVSVDMAGKVEPLGTLQRGFEDLSLSPDGKRVAATIVENASADVWIYDRERDALTRLTQKGDCGDPLWSPDGLRVVYTNPSSLLVVPADGSRPPESLNTGQWAEAESFTSDGTGLMYSTLDAANNDAALWLLLLKPGSRPTRVLPEIPRVHDGRISPDGRWLAYVSAESGSSQVYLQPFPGPGPRVQVSTDGGREPLWAPDGSRLYFRTPTRFLAAEVRTAPALAVGKPRLLFEGDFLMSHHDYGLLPDGRHFIMIQPVGRTPPAELHVVVSWVDELKARLAGVRG